MYRGFNIDYRDWYVPANLYENTVTYNNNKDVIKNRLVDLLNNDGSINGTKMQSDWFPQIQADVFISHSHQDIKRAIALAGWLERDFGLTSFIDSCIWGNAKELLDLINNKYSLNEDRISYYYNNVTYTASHIHMMLSSALSMMIDKTECLFFLNTPNSITVSNVVDQTESPWIYSEITMSQILRINIPDRHRPLESVPKGLGDKLDESPTFKYDVSLSHLKNLNHSSLDEWKAKNKTIKGVDSLDTLYGLHPIQNPTGFRHLIGIA